MTKIQTALVLALSLGLGACATESSRTLAIPTVASAPTAAAYRGPKSPIAVGKFDNRSSYLQGIFSDGIDHLGGQAKTILVTHLQQTGRFVVLDRTNMREINTESRIKNTAQRLKGADYVITGDVTEFGRKEVGDKQLFGLLGSGKEQIAYAKVALNVVDVGTSEVVFTSQGSGEYSLSNREIVGFGGTASYDSTLNGKVLDLAIRDAVDHMVANIDSGAWRPVKQP